MLEKNERLEKWLIHSLVTICFSICASHLFIMHALIGTRNKQDFILSWQTELKIGLGLFAISIIGAIILLHFLGFHLLTLDSQIEHLEGGGYLKRLPDSYFGKTKTLDSEFDELLTKAQELFQKNNR